MLKEQPKLTKNELIQNVKEILENGELHKKAVQVQKDVLRINGLKEAVKIIYRMAEGEENVFAPQNN